MTLKDYTEIAAEIMETGGSYLDELERLGIIEGKLKKLLGPQFVELGKLLVQKSGSIFLPDAILDSRESRTSFLFILAQVYEPLIERTAEKPEGGQDAAKA